MPTIKEISAITGVSKSTVSRVINNDPKVSEKTRRLVLDAIQETKYTPNIIARSMITGKLPIVLIIVGDILSYHFAKPVVGIERVLSDTGYMPVVYNSMYDEDKEQAFLDMAKQFKFAGVIPMTAIGSEQLARTFHDIDIPVVLINKKIKRSRFDAVIADEYEAGYLVTTELIRCGSHRIAYISGPNINSRINREREQGYRDAIIEQGFPIDENIIFKGNLDIASGYEAAKKIFSDPSITAVCTNNYLMAAGVNQYAAELGKRPLENYDIGCCETVSELNSGDIIYAGPDLQLIGEKAAELLLKRMQGSKEPLQNITFAVENVHNPKAAAFV
ncbi:MAG: LacI family DNA-binding transcriptional regulator [Lachnospiraceae bacterium]|nr:LacI family DNA-binding transcriptional regulator [Lachnospiraceae bacterium]